MLNRLFQERAHVETNMLAFFVRALIICAAVTAGYSIALSQSPAADLDRPVAYLTDALGRTSTIYYADLLTQLALQPGTKIDPPSKDNLETALQMVLNQRILKRPALEEADAFGWQPSKEKVDLKVREIVSFFPSPTVLAGRLKLAGFHSLQDEDLRIVLTRRSYIDWYVEVHFARCARPTPEIEEKYYKEIFIPEFRRSQPGVLIPTLDEVRRQISDTITREKINVELERHLMRARQRVRIEIVEDALDGW